eukprot:2706558-Rhodomonas_salina.1
MADAIERCRGSADVLGWGYQDAHRQGRGLPDRGRRCDRAGAHGGARGSRARRRAAKVVDSEADAQGWPRPFLGIFTFIEALSYTS